MSELYATKTLLDEVTLTADLADNTSEPAAVAPLAEIELGMSFTAAGAGRTAVIQILYSADGTNFQEYSIAADNSPSGGIVKSTLYPRRFTIPGVNGVTETRWYPLPTAAKFVKVAAAEEGGVGSTLSIIGRLSNVNVS